MPIVLLITRCDVWIRCLLSLANNNKIAQSNLGTGRITTPGDQLTHSRHARSFTCICQMELVCHLMHNFLGPSTHHFKWQLTRFSWCRFLPRDALLSAVYAVVVCLCVCLCVCVSVTLRYCIKTVKRRITQTTPHDSPMTLVFWRQRSWRNSNGISPYGGDECRWGGLKLVTFDEKRAITR